MLQLLLLSMLEWLVLYVAVVVCKCVVDVEHAEVLVLCCVSVLCCVLVSSVCCCA